MRLFPRVVDRLAVHDVPTPYLDLSLALQAERAPSYSAELAQKVRHAWSVGQTIALDGIGYGPSHWKGEAFHSAPLPYYFFLAGLVRSQGCRTICEVGTHYGGSALSMQRGMEDAAQILTLDVADINPQIARTVGITKLTGDANNTAIIKAVALHFNGRPIDLLYIDADHKFAPTLASLALYCLLLRPRLVVLDDIVLNPQMRTLWHVLTTAYGARAVNCSDIVTEIRDKTVGFGLLELR